MPTLRFNKDKHKMDVTFDYILEQYFFSKSLRPATVWSYHKVVKSFQKYTALPPGKVDHILILRWRLHVLSDLKLTPRTWNNKVAHLRALFNYGIKHGLLSFSENPFNGVVVRPGVKKKKILTKAQLDAVYRLMDRYAEEERYTGMCSIFNGRKCALQPVWFWQTVLDMLRYTAIRQNQLLHIRLCDVNLEERWIDLAISGAKNHREHRVPIVSALYPTLARLVNKAQLAEVEPEAQLFNVGLFDVSRSRKYSDGMDVTPIRGFFRRLSRECKFTVSPHRFRHTVATHMMKSPDRNLQAVKKLLGHVSITSTLEYIDESVDNLREILEVELM